MGQITDSFYNLISSAHKVNTPLNDLRIRGKVVRVEQQNLFKPGMPIYRRLNISVFIPEYFDFKMKNYYPIINT